MPDPKFDAYEMEALRLIAAEFDTGKTYLEMSAKIAAFKERDYKRFTDLETRLVAYRILHHELSPPGTKLTHIDPTLLELLHRFDNPPPVDHWEKMTVWFKGRWWSLPVLVVVVGVPALVTWIEMLRTVLGWFFPGP